MQKQNLWGDALPDKVTSPSNITEGDVRRLCYLREGFAFALPVSFALGAIDCPFLHRRGYITEGYVCDVWQCIAPEGQCI